MSKKCTGILPRMEIYKTFVLILLFLSWAGHDAMATTQAWRKRSFEISEGKVNCMFFPPKGESYILAGTDQAIYRASDRQSRFVPVLQNHGSTPAVHQIIQNLTVSSSIYSATDSGVFVSDDKGVSWRNTFWPADTLGRKCNCVLLDAKALYVGTADGLYIRQVNEQVWKKAGWELGRKEIFSLVDDAMYLYAATDSEIYRIDKNSQSIQKVYALGARTVDDGESQDEPILERQIKDIDHAGNDNQIFVASEQGISTSTDFGSTWKKISLEGLPVNQLNRFFVLSDDKQADQLYTAVYNRIFLFKENDWKNEMQDIPSHSITDLSMDSQRNLYVASDDGIFEMTQAKSDASSLSKVLVPDFKDEPTIKEVQRMAIAYANVNPSQINSWHNQARMKALFPTVSLGLNRADGEMYHWDTGPNPDVLTKGRDYLDWSTSVSWDFGDFVWSSDHTSIDSRSKLMSELRQDILDQVTRLYFERRRLQFQLASREDAEDEDFLEKEMRFEELTALLDGLTGGGFTSNQ